MNTGGNKMKAPSFQFYPTDWLGSQRVKLMTLEEEGAYINLLCSCWQHGSIPSDPQQCARLIGKGASTTLATTVLTMFQPGGGEGRMIHERLEAEKVKQAEWREKSAKGGLKSAEKRKGGTKGGSRVVEKWYQPNGNTPTSSSSPSSNTNTLSDDQWLESLVADPAYSGIDVASQKLKAERWTKENRRKFTRRFFVNWLSRSDKEITKATIPAHKWPKNVTPGITQLPDL
jgi:uncharacterized protein YdaU (DUF1376 family)